ncbi:hypothetical protein E6C27_scaffold1779G00060 [Cucumis melo var. makuwa]|uniref:Uncharacterized protein n=2 Tax=Cucumis melo TaxID=3656 RepID=A0A5A7V0D6_CUCMM|nr:hypothetical protein E6C27_scaffold1779G00060 [Cucumis melo var. makuwa]
MQSHTSKHEASSRISYLEIYLSSPNREAVRFPSDEVDGAKLVLAARLEEDRDRLGLAQARLGSAQGLRVRLGLQQEGGATRLADGLATDARRWLRLGFGVRETAAPTDARLRRSAWTILPTRLEARRRLGFDCGSAALLNREGVLGGSGSRRRRAAACGG